MPRGAALQGRALAAFSILSVYLGAAGALADSGSAGTALEGRKISHVTALLPPKGRRGGGATLRIEAFGGCYQWSSQNPELVRIEKAQPLEPGAEALECMERKALECLDRGPVLDRELFGAKTDEPEVSCQPVAILRSLVDDPADVEKVLIFARDVSDPLVELRCEVYLARVERLEVETRVRRINVDDVETVTVKAYDSNGNVFSSLEGLEFEWQVSDPSVLRAPSVVDTAFKLSPERRALALEGIQSDALLLHGLATGRASVSARLRGAGGAGAGLASAPVELTVSESIHAMPSAVRVPPMAHLQLQLKVLRGASRPFDQYPEVALPAKHFRWEWVAVEGGSDVLYVPADTGSFVAQRPGRGRVVVSDLRIENNSAYSLVDVSEPALLRVTPLPLSNASGSGTDKEEAQLLSSPPGGPTSWYFVQGRRYALRLELKDTTSQAMHIPTNFRATMRCKGSEGREAPCLLTTVRQMPSSALIVVSADTLGAGTLTYGSVSVQADASDKARGFATMEWPKLTVEQTFHVVAPLRLQSPFSGPLVLPPSHSYRLRVSGGSGTYSYTLASAKPQTVVTVSPEGVVQAGSVVGNAELFVSDSRNAANNFTLQVLVRHAGGIALKPPQLQLQLPGEASEAPGTYSVPVLARPEATEGDQGDSAQWRALRFWGCSGLREGAGGSRSELAEAVAVESSSPEVAAASVLPRGEGEKLDEGVCAVISVQPRAVGAFTLSASLGRGATAEGLARTVAGRGERLSASVDMQVFAPLELAVGGVSQASEALVAPCSSLRYELVNGPGEMQVPGHALRNLSSPLEGSHLRIRQLGAGAFEVLCVRPTPGRARLVAEVRHEPEDREQHGGPVVARGSAWISCVRPHSTQIVPAGAEVTTSTPGNGTSIGLRRGQTQRFDVHFSDAEGRAIANASLFLPQWSIEGAPQGQSWLAVKGRLAALTAPAAAAEGAPVALRAAVAVPEAVQCGKVHGLDAKQQAIAKEALAGLTAPLPDVLRLRATTDIEVRWPGFPSRRFAFAPDSAYVFEVSQGAGASRLTLDAAAAAQAIDASELCAGAVGGSDASGCAEAVRLETSAAGAALWPVRPLTPGYAVLTFEDRGQFGGAPEVVRASFLPIGRIALALADVDAPPSARGAPQLIARGKVHSLRVEVWDSENETLPPASWQPARLRVEASAPGLEVVEGPEKGRYTLVGRAAGAFEVQAVAYNHPNAVLYSNTLYVHVFETFGIEPKDMVVLPGQTFEFTLQGGPSASGAGNAHVSFSSSAAAVAEVRPGDGLLAALKPGRASVTARLTEAATGRKLAEATANVTVALPDAAAIQPVRLGGAAKAGAAEDGGPLAVIRGAAEPLRLSAALSSKGLPLSLPLLSAPVGAAEEGRASRGCSFRWTSSLAALSLSPSTPVGAVVVDVAALKAAANEPAEASAEITVEVSCPGASRLKASRSLLVVQPLQLVAPAATAAPASVGSPLLVAMPPLGRVSLVFSRPREHLEVKLAGLAEGGAAGSRPVAELDDNGSSVELAAGPEEGEALLVVQDPRSGSALPPLLISVAVRTPQSVHLIPHPRRLPLHSTVECRVLLADARGAPIALPPNYVVSHYVSHPSVLASELLRTADGEAVVRLRAAREGCAAVGLEAQAPGPATSAGSEAVAVCVGRGALVGRGPLLVHPGAHVHLPAETAAVAPEDGQALAFSLRLACAAGGVPQSSSQLARDVARALRLADGAVRVVASQWSPSSPAACGCATALDVDLEISGDLPRGWGLRELADALWFPADARSLGPALQLLDRSFGLRATAAAPASPCGPCTPRPTWSSSEPAALQVDASGLEATARRPGSAVAAFDHAGIKAGVDVEVARLAEAILESAVGGPRVEVAGTDGQGSRSFVTNVLDRGSLVVPLRFFAPAAETGAGDLREFRSGPFQTQDIDFACEPAEAELAEFFDFEEWSLANISAGESDADSATPLPALDASAAQAACVLRPRRTQARHWAERMPPRALELKVVVTTHEALGQPGRPSTRATARWPFLPQFAAMDDQGKQLDAGVVCATVTPEKPVATVWVWTGGQPVEVWMEQQLRESRGRVSLHVRSSPPGSSVPTASMSVSISWESPAAWPGAEELVMVLESRASGQVERLRVRVQGAQLEPVPGAAAAAAAPPPRGTWFGTILGLLARGLPLLLVVAVCQRCCGKCWAMCCGSSRQAPRPQPAVAASLFGPAVGDADLFGSNRGGSVFANGPSPFRRVDLRG